MPEPTEPEPAGPEPVGPPGASTPQPSLVVRPAGPADVPAVIELVQSAYRDKEGGGWTTEAHLVSGNRTSAEEVLHHIEADRSAILVGELDGDMVACCHIRAVDRDRAYFGMFGVRPARQGGGVGRAMVEAAERVAAATWGCTVMEMNVIGQRHELIAWYERLGYSDTGRTAPFPYDKDDDIPTRPDLYFTVMSKPMNPGGRTG